MEKTKRNKFIVLVLFALVFFLQIFGNILVSSSEAIEDIVPLTRLPWIQHVIFFYLIYPIIGSIITMILFPLIIIPIFLKIKGKILYRYSDCYVEMGEIEFSMKIFLKRGIYISLLLLGLIISFGFLINPEVLLNKYSVESTNYPDNLLFDANVLSALFFLLSPLVVGLWAVGWVMEDIGLMHYKFPKENERILFEIEPIHVRYNGILKGYAGISAIIFITNAFIVYLGVWPLHILQVGVTVFMMIFFLAPVYFLYLIIAQRLFGNLFRKSMDEIEVLSEDTIKKKH